MLLLDRPSRCVAASDRRLIQLVVALRASSLLLPLLLPGHARPPPPADAIAASRASAPRQQNDGRRLVHSSSSSSSSSTCAHSSSSPCSWLGSMSVVALWWRRAGDRLSSWRARAAPRTISFLDTRPGELSWVGDGRPTRRRGARGREWGATRHGESHGAGERAHLKQAGATTMAMATATATTDDGDRGEGLVGVVDSGTRRPPWFLFGVVFAPELGDLDGAVAPWCARGLN